MGLFDFLRHSLAYHVESHSNLIRVGNKPTNEKFFVSQGYDPFPRAYITDPKAVPKHIGTRPIHEIKVYNTSYSQEDAQYNAPRIKEALKNKEILFVSVNDKVQPSWNEVWWKQGAKYHAVRYSNTTTPVYANGNLKTVATSIDPSSPIAHSLRFKK